MNRKAMRVEPTAATVVTVGSVRFGRDPFPVIAGPCAVENEDQLREVAKSIADAGASILRGGLFRSPSSPYAFRGLGASAVPMLAAVGAEVGLPTVTQVAEASQVEAVAGHVDMVEVASSSMQDFELLRVIGRSGLPVLLRRGPSATLDEWLWAAEYVLAEGNEQVVLVERGIRTFDRSGGDTLDLSSVPALEELSHLPVVVDPSHSAGGPDRVIPLALAAQGVGADGLIVEVHPRPEASRVDDRPRQLDPARFGELMDALGIRRLRHQVDIVDREIVRLVARRQELAAAIGEVKATRDMPVHIPDREEELLAIIDEEATHVGLDRTLARHLFELILEASRAEQRRRRGMDETPGARPLSSSG